MQCFVLFSSVYYWKLTAVILAVFKRQHYVFHIFTGCTFVRQFPVLQFLPPEISLSVIFRPCSFHPLKFLCPSFSGPAVSSPWNFFVRHFPACKFSVPNGDYDKVGDHDDDDDDIVMTITTMMMMVMTFNSMIIIWLEIFFCSRVRLWTNVCKLCQTEYYCDKTDTDFKLRNFFGCSAFHHILAFSLDSLLLWTFDCSVQKYSQVVYKLY